MVFAFMVELVLSVALAFALGAGATFLYFTRRPKPRWPLIACDSSGRTAMDYLFDILDEAKSRNAPHLGEIRKLARRCMSHSDTHYEPPPSYPHDGHCECLHKALEGANAGNWQLVVDELNHDG